MKPTIKIAVLHNHTFAEETLQNFFSGLGEIEIITISSNEEYLISTLKDKIIDFLLIDFKGLPAKAILTAKKFQSYYQWIKCVIVNTESECVIKPQLDAITERKLANQTNDIQVKCELKKFVGAIVVEHSPKQSYCNASSFQASKDLCNEKSLSKREIEVVRLISKEYTNKQIADRLCLSTRTLDGHKERIMQKTKAKNAIGIVMYAAKFHLL